MDTINKVITVLAQRKGIDPATVKPESSFAELAYDSLDVAEMVMELEDEFGVQLELSREVQTVADLVRKIDEAKK